MCFVQLRCDSSESATILNERNQSLEREKFFRRRKEVQSDGFPLKPIAWIFWLWNQSDGYKLPFN